MGQEFIPDVIETSKLPYLTACLMEVLRWRPPTPQSLPRMCTADEDILGYRIPKGSMVLLNVWAIQHDPAYYDRPEQFDPERLMRSPYGTKMNAGESQRSTVGIKPLYTFGAGRRACPGEHFALNTLHTAFSQLLWHYDFLLQTVSLTQA